LQQQAKIVCKLSYSVIHNVLTDLLPAGLQDFFQVLNVSNASFINSFNQIVQSTALPLSRRKFLLSTPHPFFNPQRMN